MKNLCAYYSNVYLMTAVYPLTFAAVEIYSVRPAGQLLSKTMKMTGTWIK